tara:strand:- start:1431 stop:1658 length:228 start_codon:yes stop_codon:yes gene_type:complete
MILLTLMTAMPVMASPMVGDDIYDQLYEAFEEARNERRKRWRTSPEDSINKALMEYYYGSNDPTVTKELLQLPSD